MDLMMLAAVVLGLSVGWFAGAFMILSALRNEVRSGLVTFSGEAWRTTKIEPHQ